MDAPAPINPFAPVPTGHYTGPMRLRVNGLPGARIDQERVAQLQHLTRVMADQCFAHCRAFGAQQAMRRHIEADGTRIQVNVIACSYPPMVTAWIWTPELPVLEGQPVHINEDQVWIPGLFLVGDYVLEPPTGITPNFCSLVAEQNGWRLFTRPKHPVTGEELIQAHDLWVKGNCTEYGVAFTGYTKDGDVALFNEGGRIITKLQSYLDRYLFVWNHEGNYVGFDTYDEEHFVSIDIQSGNVNRTYLEYCWAWYDYMSVSSDGSICQLNYEQSLSAFGSLTLHYEERPRYDLCESIPDGPGYGRDSKNYNNSSIYGFYLFN